MNGDYTESKSYTREYVATPLEYWPRHTFKKFGVIALIIWHNVKFKE